MGSCRSQLTSSCQTAIIHALGRRDDTPNLIFAARLRSLIACNPSTKKPFPMNAPLGPTLYDEIPYPGGIFPPTHPEHLATLGALYGMKPADVGSCRVLELGCGFGGNLVPMAYCYPKAKFVGIDLSSSSIARGQQTVRTLGVRNLELRHLDILDVGSDFGEFDFIVSHGVYSWVPDNVRDKMLEIFKANLAPQGICYVSYNAFPYSHVRNLVRDMFQFHTRHISDSRQKVAQARAILGFLSDAAEANTLHGAMLRDQYERISKMVDEFFFHDDLNEIAEAFLLHQVVERAQNYGLQYLSDADFARGNTERYKDNVRSVLQSFPDDELVARSQYQDFIDGFGFRRTLLCHDDVVLQRTIPLEFFRRCYFTRASVPVESEHGAKPESELQLTTRDQSTLGISDEFAKSVYRSLSEVWPRALSFDQLVRRGREQHESNFDEDVLAQILHRFSYNDAVAFSLYPRSHSKPKANKLLASELARKQSEVGLAVTNVLHQTVRLENHDACRILQLLDGTRDLDQLVSEVYAFRPSRPTPAKSDDGSDDVNVTHALVQKFLVQAKKLGLMLD
jgi:methyltransferase-like protein/2-polyprenyl-3-methyl-5-hydroxy-6-metoxy-1,4-benzoquinol methylase